MMIVLGITLLVYWTGRSTKAPANGVLRWFPSVLTFTFYDQIEKCIFTPARVYYAKMDHVRFNQRVRRMKSITFSSELTARESLVAVVLLA